MRECRYMIGTSLTGTQGTRQEAASDIYRSLFYPGTFVREDKRSIRNQTSVTNFRNHCDQNHGSLNVARLCTGSDLKI